MTIWRVDSLARPKLEGALAAAPDRLDNDPMRYSFLDRQVMRTMGGASFKIPVPAIFEPAPSANPEMKVACLASLDVLLAIFETADGKRLSGLKVASPASDRIRLSLLGHLEGTVKPARCTAIRFND